MGNCRNNTFNVICNRVFLLIDDLGRAVEELVTVITEQEFDTAEGIDGKLSPVADK